MAQVPEGATLPSVQQQPIAASRISAPDLPNSTVAGVLGTQAEGYGKAVEQVSDVYAKHAEQLAMLNNKAMSDAANTAYMGAAGKLQADFDEKAKFVSPDDASKLYADHVAQLEQLRQTQRQGLDNPMAQSLYDQDSRRMQGYLMMGASRTVAAGVTAYRNTVFNAAIDTYSQDAATATDPAQIEHDKEAISNVAFSHYAIDLGLPKDVVTNAITQHMSAVNSSVIEQRLKTDPVGAHDYLEANKHEMTPAAYGQYSEKVDQALNVHFTDQIANSVTAGIAAQAQSNPAVAAAAHPGSVSPGIAAIEAGVTHSFPGARVTSDVRTPGQNAAVSGVVDSAHEAGRAVDFHIPAGMTGPAFAAAVQAKYPDAKVIYEGPGAAHSTAPHVHVQLGGAAGSSAGDRIEALQQNAPDIFARADAQAEAVAKQYGLDPEVLKQNVDQKLQSDFARQDFIYRQQTDGIKSNLIQNILTGGPGGTPITNFTDFMRNPDNASGYAQLNGQGQKAIQATIRGELQQTSPIEKARIDGMKVTDMQGFLAMDPTKNSQLSPKDQAGIMEEQVRLRGDLKKQADYHASLSLIDNNRLLNSSLEASGILGKDGKVKDQKGYDVYTGRMFQEINAWLARNPQAKGHIPPEEVGKIGAQVLPTLGASPGDEYDIWPGGPKIGTFGAKAGTTSPPIPDDAYNSIYSNFTQRYGRAPQDWEVGEAYQQVLDARGRK